MAFSGSACEATQSATMSVWLALIGADDGPGQENDDSQSLNKKRRGARHVRKLNSRRHHQEPKCELYAEFQGTEMALGRQPPAAGTHCLGESQSAATTKNALRAVHSSTQYKTKQNNTQKMPLAKSDTGHASLTLAVRQ